MQTCPECGREYDATYEVCDCGYVFASGELMSTGGKSVGANAFVERAILRSSGHGACGWGCLAGILAALALGVLGLVAGGVVVLRHGDLRHAGEAAVVVPVLYGAIGAAIGVVVGGLLGAIVAWYTRYAHGWKWQEDRANDPH